LPAVVLALTAAPARANCPTKIDELPAAGLVASMTRVMTDPDAEEPPTVQARIAAAGGLRAERDAVAGTGELGGELTLHRGGLTGCVDAQLVAARDPSLHTTASVHVPLILTALAIGVSLDRDVELPLASRPRYLRAPASRIAGHFSLSFVDLGIGDGAGHRLRIMVVPVALEQALDRQEVGGIAYERRTTAFETSLMRFAPDDGKGPGRFDIFRAEADWIDRDTMDPVVTGFMRVAPLSLESRRRWRIVLDGGILAIAGSHELDCKQVTCATGYYRLGFGYNWRGAAVEVNAERSGFLAADLTPLLDDRIGVTGELFGPRRGIATTAFAALTRPWFGGPTERTGGVRVTATQELGRGFVAIVDGELARGYYGGQPDPEMPAPAITDSARVLVSLGWQITATR
jgi:hypothetical protein